MLKIGITGGIGSGKTTVCHIFEVLGIPVFYADDAAKEVMTQDPELMQRIREVFGEDSYRGAVLDRAHIAAQAFSDPDKLRLLNEAVHPAVFRSFDRWIAQQQAPYVLKEAALMFESGSYLKNDINVLVYADTETRMKRALTRDQATPEQVQARMSRQMPEEEKRKMADLVILNDDDSLLIPQVMELHQQWSRNA